MKLVKDQFCRNCNQMIGKDNEFEFKNLHLDANFNGLYEFVCPICGGSIFVAPWDAYEYL